MPKIDLASLFEGPNGLLKFDDEFSALKDGRKAMSIFEFSRSSVDSLDEVDRDYLDLVGRAFDAGLLVVHQPMEPRRATQIVNVFIVKHDQLWRVSAFIQNKAAFRQRRWSDGAEALESSLLGYGEEAVAAWMEYMTMCSAGWGVATLYLMMTTEQKQIIIESGSRHLPTEALMPAITLFEVPANQVPKRASSEPSPGFALGRVGVKHQLERRLFGTESSESETLSVEITEVDVREINRDLETKIEFWSGSGWH